MPVVHAEGEQDEIIVVAADPQLALFGRLTLFLPMAAVVVAFAPLLG